MKAGGQSFTEKGIRLQSGRELPADIIVTVTGLKLLLLGHLDRGRRQAGGVRRHDELQGRHVIDVPNLGFCCACC